MDRTGNRAALGRWFVAATLAMALLGLAGPAAAQTAPVFAPSGGLIQGPLSSPASIAEVPISLNLAPLAAGEPTIELSRLDGTTFKAARTGFESRGKSGYVWRGHVVAESDATEGDVTLTVSNGLLAGLVTLTGEAYEIQPRGGNHRLIQLDQGLFPPCGTGEGDGVVADPIPGRPVPNVAAGNLTGQAVSEVDVMAVYTPQAQTGAGGQASIQATIQSAVDVANTSFAASGIDVHFNLVHTALVNHNDSANTGTDLAWVAGDPTVKALRNQHYADLVALIVENGGSGVCGQAYVQRSISSGFSESAYQVTVRSCAVGNISYAHEHGHNMGFEHNPENGISPPSSASYPWSYGHYVNGSFRTVMSYADPCTSGCTRVQRFSNPSINYNGVPTGIADARDNHRTGNISAPIVAGFRVAGLDTDGDGIEDIADNCPTTPNSDQLDTDGDGIGNACDLDIDQVQKINPPENQSGDALGWSVAVRGDRAVAGAWLDDDLGTDSGSAYLFSWNGSAWTQEAKVHASDGVANQHFGYRGEVSGDAAVIGVGAGNKAYVFRRSSAGTWSQEAIITGISGDTLCGTDVSIDGNTIALGCPGSTARVHVFTFTGGTWTLTQTITPPAGGSAAEIIRLRGSLLLVSAWSASPAGRVYVYRKSTTWTQEATLAPPAGTTSDFFGLGLDASGDTVVVGAQFYDQPATNAGVAYVFKKNGTWSQVATLAASDAVAGDSFGRSASIDGNFIAIGASGDDSYSGSVYLYRLIGSTWSLYAKVAGSERSASDQFGQDVSVSGRHMLVGASGEAGKGAVYAFRLPAPDGDGDGIPDSVDNCPTVANPGQQDVDNDGIGDACDTCTDIDHDGYGSPGHASCTAGAATDCDDSNPSVNPGHVEVAGNGADDDCNPATLDCVDGDGDGYSVSGGVCGPVDCSDSNANVNPGHAEVAGNGVDDDCNAATPDCVDADGDGSSVSGGVCGALDCNDGVASIHPGATEVCNQTDDDCDGQFDEGVTTTFFRDADGDTYGNAGVTTQACSAPGGYVANSTDCNDGNPSVNPGHAEVPGNGVDDDCNPATTDCLDADGDGYSPSGGSCGPVDCNDSNGDVNPGHAEVPGNGVDDDCNAGTADCVDADADGYSSSGGACGAVDCLDSNANVNPGRTEVPGNGLDDDCNSATSDCKDLDADGYGNPASAACAHAQLDCNDSNVNVNPGRTEIPSNGIDDDCNAATPGGCSAP
ncbi:MAG: MopE-related protein [bacterium]